MDASNPKSVKALNINATAKVEEGQDIVEYQEYLTRKRTQLLIDLECWDNIRIQTWTPRLRLYPSNFYC